VTCACFTEASGSLAGSPAVSTRAGRLCLAHTRYRGSVAANLQLRIGQANVGHDRNGPANVSEGRSEGVDSRNAAKPAVSMSRVLSKTSFPEEQKNRLEKALTDAAADHLVETYPGARHGFAVPDVPVFDAAAAERHWAAMFKLYNETLAQ
jgi:hypothetical protein